MRAMHGGCVVRGAWAGRGMMRCNTTYHRAHAVSCGTGLCTSDFLPTALHVHRTLARDPTRPALPPHLGGVTHSAGTRVQVVDEQRGHLALLDDVGGLAVAAQGNNGQVQVRRPRCRAKCSRKCSCTRQEPGHACEQGLQADSIVLTHCWAT